MGPGTKQVSDGRDHQVTNRVKFSVSNTNAVSQRGFTLIELMVVLSVLGLLAVFTTPRFMEEMNLLRAHLTAEDTAAIMEAARSYRVSTAPWPGSASSCNNAIAVLKAGGRGASPSSHDAQFGAAQPLDCSGLS